MMCRIVGETPTGHAIMRDSHQQLYLNACIEADILPESKLEVNVSKVYFSAMVN